MVLGKIAPLRQPEIRSMLAVAVGTLVVVGSSAAAITVCALLHYWMVAVYCIQMGLIIFFMTAIVGRLLARGGKCPQVPPTDNLTVVITGANTGIGKATAAALVQAGAHVVLACRSEAKARAAIAEIADSSAREVSAESEKLLADMGRPPVASRLEFMQLDLSSFQSIRKFADEWGSRPLHILINNAGVMMCPYNTTREGHEMQFGTNHLGHFLLTLKLLPALRLAAHSGSWKPRVICVASMAHVFAPKLLQWENVSEPANYSKTENYGYSKLANILFAREFQRRYGDTVNAYSLHPGAVQTELIRHLPGLVTWPTVLLRKIIFKTPREGSQTSLFCATSARAVPGQYHADCQLGPKSEAAADDEEARHLWELSLDLVQEP